MANRGRRVPGNALASKLREVELRSRPGRSRGPAGATGATGATGQTGQPGASVASSVQTTGVGGTVTWTFPQPLAAVPVVAAVAAAGVAVIVTVTAVSATAVTVAAWTIAGAARPATPVHITLS